MKTIGSSSPICSVLTSVPAGIGTGSGCGAVRVNSRSVAADADPNSSMPISSRNFTYSRSGTWFIRYKIISVIQAYSSISATPGSETLWSVHSGQSRWIRRLDSSTMSWKRAVVQPRGGQSHGRTSCGMT